MSLVVLDTDILSLYYEGHPVLVPRVDAHPKDQTAITVMSVEEQLTGWYTLLRQAKQPPQVAHAYRRLADTVQFLGRWQIFPYPESTIARYEQLKALKLNVAKMDLRIAAITLENGGILITRNFRDFQRIPNLTIEDWST